MSTWSILGWVVMLFANVEKIENTNNPVIRHNSRDLVKRDRKHFFPLVVGSGWF